MASGERECGVSALDAVRSVRWSAAYVAGVAEEVKLGDAETFALAVAELDRIGPRSSAWEMWHYADDVESGGELTARYVFVLDTLNFCFWPSPAGIEYEHLALGLRAALRANPHAFDPEELVAATPATVQSWFKDCTTSEDIPLLEERVARVQELGHVLQSRYKGSALEFIRQANNSAPELVSLVARELSSFRDETALRGRRLCFYKRAQILVGDLWAAFGSKTKPTDGDGGSGEGGGVGGGVWFGDMEKLTMFADYRVPQILRHLGVLKFSDSLAKAIEDGEVLDAGGRREIEIRAMSILAVERLREALESSSKSALGSLNSVQLDWVLWEWGEREKDKLPPFHKTISPFY